MGRVIKKLVFAGIVLFVCQNAQAGLFDNITSQVTQAVSSASKKPQAQRQPDQAEQQQPQVTNNTPANPDNSPSEGDHPVVDIKEGAYKIPFGVGVDEVLKWLNKEIDDKQLGDVTINNFSYTQEELENDIRNELIKQVGGHSEQTYAQDVQKGAEELQKAPVSQIRDIANKIIHGEQTPYYFVNLDVPSLQKSLDFLDNPPPSYMRFTFKGRQYVLSDVFNCQNVKDPSIAGICKDEAWKGRNYQLDIIPSDKSMGIAKDGAVSITVKFYRDGDNPLKSYATIIQFNGGFKEIVDGISQKYGQYAEVNTPLYLGVMMAMPSKDITMGATTSFIWRKNIAMLLNASQEGYLLHYEPALGDKMMDDYNATIKNIISDQQMQNNQQAERAKNNF